MPIEVQFQLSEIAVFKACCCTEICQSLTGGLQRFLILIQPDQQAAGGAAFQNQSGVACSAQGAVQIYSARLRVQEMNDLSRQDRLVAEGLHSNPQGGQRFGFQREVLLILDVDAAVGLLTPDIETLAHADEPDIPLESGMGTQC
jgi:hypothetical protein